jgi:hypothetical protein
VVVVVVVVVVQFGCFTVALYFINVYTDVQLCVCPSILYVTALPVPTGNIADFTV